MPIKHNFVSPLTDGSNTDEVRPSNWNADHSITCTAIPDSADLNDYLTAGFYHCGLDSYAANGSNYPEATAGLLEVYTADSMIYQRYTCYDNTHRVYIRTKYTTTWYSWATQWSSLNDGTGSGLDADKLDGAEPSATGGTANAIIKADASGLLDNAFLPMSPNSGTFRIPQVVERKTITSGSPVSTTTFSSLNGDVDKEYLLKFNIYKNGTGDIQFKIEFNSDTGYNYSSQVKGYVDNSGSVIEDTLSLSQQILRVGQTRWSAVNWVNGETYIRASTGNPRFARSKCTFYMDQSHSGFDITSGFWNNTTNNITSMVFKNTSTNTFYGTLDLYKLVDLVIS